MNLLAIESSTEFLSVAVACGEEIFARDCLAGQRHSELVLPMIEEALAAAGLARSELEAIAFGAGPGSFTGLRIACGVAQGLAFGLDRPVVAVPTLLALAAAGDAARVIAALDARMGEVYHAAYARGADGWQTVVAPNLCAPHAAPAVEGGGWVGVGSGFAAADGALAERYAGQLGRVEASAVPHAREVAQLARDGFAGHAFVAAEHAAPLYLRNKVALTVGEQANAR